jgi:hypothetical protein
MEEEGSKGLANVGIKGRIRQLLILLIAIILGVIISSALNAQDFHKAKKHYFKIKYKTQIRQAHRECDILNKKRNARTKAPLFATQSRKPKYKPQAEVDTPGASKTGPVASNN